MASSGRTLISKHSWTGKILISALMLIGSNGIEISSKVVRIDLEKHYIPHVEFEDLEESEEDDGQIEIDELDENNFSMLREIQK